MIWGIHHDGPHDLVAAGAIAIGWVAAGDLTRLPDDRDDFKARLRETYAGRGEPWVAAAAGQLLRFRHRMQPGDLVVHPRKADRTINVGRIASGYAYEPDAWPRYPNRRAVRWLVDGVPREALSQGCRNELGSSLSVFTVRRHRDELLGLLPARAASAVPAPR